MNTRFSPKDKQVISGQDLLERNLRAGMHRLGYDLLRTAMIDKRLSRTHTLILGLITISMEHHGYARPSRQSMAVWAGVTPKRVSNVLSDLAKHGYLERVNIEEDSARVFTFGHTVEHDALLAEITTFCAQMRDSVYGESSPPGGNKSSPAAAESSPSGPKSSPAGPNSSRGGGNFSEGAAKSSPSGHQSSRGGGNFPSSHDIQHEGHSLLEDNIYIPTTTTSLSSLEGRAKSTDRSSVVVGWISEWMNAPRENAEQWLANQIAIANGNDALVYEAIRILRSRIDAGDLIARKMAFLSQTIHKLAAEKASTPAKESADRYLDRQKEIEKQKQLDKLRKI